MKFHFFFRQLDRSSRYHFAAIVASLVAFASPSSAANDDPDGDCGSERAVKADNDRRAAATLYFGQLAFVQSDIALLTQGFDDNGFPVLDIALQPEATKRVAAETVRLLDTDVTLSLGSIPLISARLVEPITEGKLRISGLFSLGETRTMAGQIICAMGLSTGQYEPASLAPDLPCSPDNTQ